jgi:hypothetical protein
VSRRAARIALALSAPLWVLPGALAWWLTGAPVWVLAGLALGGTCLLAAALTYRPPAG